MNIGDLLRAFGLVSREQLQAALDLQRRRAPHKRIGEILVSMGATTQDKIDEVLHKQGLIREDPSKASADDVEKLVDYAAETAVDAAEHLK